MTLVNRMMVSSGLGNVIKVLSEVEIKGMVMHSGGA